MEIMKLDKDSVCIVRLPIPATDKAISVIRNDLDKIVPGKFIVSFPDVTIEEIPEKELNRIGYFKKESHEPVH